MGQFVSQTVVPEEWKENFRMSRPFLLKLSEELRPYIEGKSTRMRQPVDVVKKVTCHAMPSQRILGVFVWMVGNAMKTVVWTRIN